MDFLLNKSPQSISKFREMNEDINRLAFNLAVKKLNI